MSNSYHKQSYLDEFLNLKSCGDILNIISPFGSAQKEISESMGIIKLIKPITLKKPMHYTLYDFCAGNALTSIISVFLLPIKNAIAIDRKQRTRKWEMAKRFEYKFVDIYDFDISKIDRNSIVCGVHPCKELAERIIWIFNQSQAQYLFLMPCCNGKIKKILPTAINDKINKPMRWCYELYTQIETDDKNIIQDKKILSPRNLIIIARKQNIIRISDEIIL